MLVKAVTLRLFHGELCPIGSGHKFVIFLGFFLLKIELKISFYHRYPDLYENNTVLVNELL
jgi:hypothetical protein